MTINVGYEAQSLLDALTVDEQVMTVMCKEHDCSWDEVLSMYKAGLLVLRMDGSEGVTYLSKIAGSKSEGFVIKDIITNEFYTQARTQTGWYHADLVWARIYKNAEQAQRAIDKRISNVNPQGLRALSVKPITLSVD